MFNKKMFVYDPEIFKKLDAIGSILKYMAILHVDKELHSLGIKTDADYIQGMKAIMKFIGEC